MGQKINPISNRLPLSANWKSRWFAHRSKDFRQYLITDLKMRQFIKKRLATAGVKEVEISRSRDRLNVHVITSKPGLVIGRGGQGINALKEELQRLFYPGNVPVVRLEIFEEKYPDTSATLVSQDIASQIERRIPFRRACRQITERVMSQKNVHGLKIQISGRLNGAEIARTEKFQEGSIPLSRFKQDIDFAIAHARTTYGVIGVKVWINKGEFVTQEEKD